MHICDVYAFRFVHTPVCCFQINEFFHSTKLIVINHILHLFPSFLLAGCFDHEISMQDDL